MKRIYKYEVDGAGKNDVWIPKDSTIFSSIEQHGNIVIYAMVNPEEELDEVRRIVVKGTGWDIEDEVADNLRFIATIKDGSLVWHIFEDLRWG